MGFWNGVDLRFRDFNYPHVRLSIAGILIAEVCDDNHLHQIIIIKIVSNNHHFYVGRKSSKLHL